MAPNAASSGVSIRLTEPYLLLVGGPELERARARRRRALRQTAATTTHDTPAATSDVRSGGTPLASPAPSRSASRAGSRATSPVATSRGRLPGPASPPPDSSSSDFVPPPSRGRSGSRQRNLNSSRGRSTSRQPPAAIEDALTVTTGSGTLEEALLADEPPPAMLRGLLTVTLSKPSRIREITVRLKGIARTEWPEGIGPRRMDTMEETVLTNITSSFFTATTEAMQRRAASIGPGSGDQGRSDSRGRPSRRAASMQPLGDLQAPPASGSTLCIHEESTYRAPLSALSRIASFADLEDAEHDAPPVRRGESAPAYEVVDSHPSSPAASRPTSRPGSRSGSRGRGADPNDLSRALLDPSLNAPRRLDSSLPPPRSPLSHSTALAQAPNSDNVPLAPLDRTQTSGSRRSVDTQSSAEAHHSASQEPSRDVSTASSINSHGSTDTEAGNAWSSAPVLTSTSQNDRDTMDQPHQQATGPSPSSQDPSADHTFQSRASTHPTASPAASTSRPSDRSGSGSQGRRASNSSTRTAAPPRTGVPSALKSTSSAEEAHRGTSKTRFSLASLSDALRGKSSSRARDDDSGARGDHASSGSPSIAPSTSSRRDDSPGPRISRTRDQSRGRRTALKALREALTAGAGAPHPSHGADSEDEHDDERATGWKDFRAGSYTYPISIAVPASLPPTINSDFGHVGYTLKATVYRAGALTSNLTTTHEVVLVSAPGQDDTEENESIVVERFWETQMKYHVALSGKSFPIGGSIPISIRLHPMAKIKVYRITAILEQKTNYYASNRRLTRHETPKKFPLLRIEHKDPKEPLLPILSDESDAIATHPLAEFFINPTSADDTTPSLLDPIGPWSIESHLKLPTCSSKLNFSTGHDRANISIAHILKIMLRVERGDDDFLDSKGKRKLWDVIIESPIHILSCHCAQNGLPAYSASSVSNSSTAPAHSCESSSHSTHRLGVNMHMSIGGSRQHHQHGAASPTASSSPHPGPPVATMAQNLLYARLVAGEETPAGETPPTYDVALTAPTEPPAASRSRSRLRRLSDASIGTIMGDRAGRSSERGREEERRGRASERDAGLVH